MNKDAEQLLAEAERLLEHMTTAGFDDMRYAASAPRIIKRLIQLAAQGSATPAVIAELRKLEAEIKNAERGLFGRNWLLDRLASLLPQEGK